MYVSEEGRGDNMKTRKIIALFAVMAFASATWAATPLDALRDRVSATSPAGAGVALAEVVPGGLTITTSIGDASLQPNTTFRIASNTKTYVAATALRLWEDGKLKLDASIRTYLDPATIAILDKDGYDTARITVRHLLSHTSGMNDHTRTKEFDELLDTHPETAWTRASQLDALVRWTDPVGAPGEKFFYSDDGYCLLGMIIEGLTGQPLAVAVHTILDYDKLGLAQTYWETKEPVAAHAGARAHQLFDAGQDTYDWNPSLDMFGGGGLVASPQDMARFLFVLFEGKVFKHPETLQLMLSRDGLPADSPYRLGLFEIDVDGVKAYWHSGFWGTAAIYVPSQHRAYAFAVTRRGAYKPAWEQLKATVASGS
jgi:D-alanyl-D-alanine carboxypeptidase